MSTRSSLRGRVPDLLNTRDLHIRDELVDKIHDFFGNNDVEHDNFYDIFEGEDTPLPERAQFCMDNCQTLADCTSNLQCYSVSALKAMGYSHFEMHDTHPHKFECTNNDMIYYADPTFFCAPSASPSMSPTLSPANPNNNNPVFRPTPSPTVVVEPVPSYSNNVLFAAVGTGTVVSAIAIFCACLCRRRRKWREYAKLRAEILRRLKIVAPEQVPNLENILIQFKGKELELIDQLRLMKPRNNVVQVQSPMATRMNETLGASTPPPFPFDLQMAFPGDSPPPPICPPAGLASPVQTNTRFWARSTGVLALSSNGSPADTNSTSDGIDDQSIDSDYLSLDVMVMDLEGDLTLVAEGKDSGENDPTNTTSEGTLSSMEIEISQIPIGIELEEPNFSDVDDNDLFDNDLDGEPMIEPSGHMAEAKSETNDDSDRGDSLDDFER
ncbi:hypothetical protein TrST_g11087 [Triparma strigata]|uniref:Uncharacterized protein n=1 Tax=Triparma strigata TaxID=1606541 RepID=A0A9W7AF30_9STRA|nr:hypothetical protein TrST_g11087 [Triparma strigata]